jgi:hypothetical protein
MSLNRPLSARRRNVAARPELILDEVERPPRLMQARKSRTASFVAHLGPDGQLDRGKLAVAAMHGIRSVRWHADEVQGGRP